MPRRLLAALALASAGCGTFPTPLAPGLKGSVGLPHQGVLTSSDSLPATGAGFKRLRPAADTNHGTPALVHAIENAAKVVAQLPTDPPLVVGDMAGPKGGRLAGHHSHRTGRDADILFFYTTPSGVPVEAPGFVKVGADGLAFVRSELGGPSFVRFDVAKNWSLVKAFLRSDDAEVEWMFVSETVEAILVDYARSRGEPDDLVWRAESVLHQPGDSTPHDDHFHLRIACTADEALAGCVNGGPAWPWLKAQPAWTTELDAKLAELVNDEGEGEGSAAEAVHARP